MSLEFRERLKNDEDVFALYESLGWNEHLNLSSKQLIKAMKNSFKTIYVYDGQLLVGTGRIVSDGFTDAYICGLGILPNYRNQGIGGEILNLLLEDTKENNLFAKLFCEESLKSYYEEKGFSQFALGMKYKTVI